MKSKLITISLFVGQLCLGQLSPMDILKKSAGSMKKLRSIQYTFFAEQHKQKINGEININRVKPFPIFQVAQVKFVAFSVSDEGTSQISFASDGSVFEFIDRTSGKLIRVDGPSIASIMQNGIMSYAMLPLPCFLQAEPFNNMVKNLTAATMEADTIINNISCYKLKVVTEGTVLPGEMMHEVYWYIGKEDLLVRGMHSKFLKQFIKIISKDRPYTSGDFSLTPANISVKRTEGNEPLSDGLLAIGTPSPSWKLSSNRSEDISLESLKGKVVLLDFWGTWCMPCIKAMPDIQSIADHFKEKPVEVIGISVELKNSNADAAVFAKTKGFTYTIGLNGNEVAEKFKIRTYPTVYIIGKDGKIVHAEHSGGRENFKPDIIKRIERALQQ